MEESLMLDWEMEEEMRSGKVSWILNKGLVFGKKVLMTGMLITSAPFVLPPLMAISAFGVAASLPSGLFLASYACSEKLMSSLLPGSSPPNSPFLLPGYYFEFSGGDSNAGLFEQDIEEEQKQIDDTTARVDQMRIELPADQVHASDDKENKVDHDANSSNNLSPNDDHQLQDKIETPHENDEFGRNDIIPVEEQVGGHEISIKEEGELELELAREKLGDKNVVDEGSKHDDITAEEMDMPIEAKSAAAVGKSGGKRKGKKKGGKVVINPKQNEEIRNDSAKRDDDSVKVDEEATVSTLQHHQGKVTGDKNNKEGAKAAGTRKKIHHSGRLTDQPAAGLKKEELVVDSEEDIRKQIEAVKTVVGYKGTPKQHHASSCLEELKALYIFTGVVEPPPPPKESSSSDIEELSHKLKFLMSIVGLK